MTDFRHWYLSHAEVEIDPERPVTDWGLSARGRGRLEAFVTSGRVPAVTLIASSAERKAVETADILARALSLAVTVRTDLGENDRTSTGYLPPAEFEAMADAFFANPGVEIRGWESAAAAQARIVGAVQAVLEEGKGPVLFVGHGAVGTLLWCHLAGNGIDRRHDQPAGGGCIYGFGGGRAPDPGWRRIEDWRRARL